MARKTKAKKKLPAKRGKRPAKAGPVATAPIVAPNGPKEFRARVRMYRQGLGDCFLLTFPQKGKRPFNILIDCGVLVGTKEEMTKVVEHVRDTIREGRPNRKARIDVVVGTHEHKDHLSGFNQARAVFNNDFDFGAVWLGWTENLTKPEIKKIKQAKKKVAEMLRKALVGPRGIAARLTGVDSLLAFSEEDDKSGSGKIADALDYLKLRGKEADALRYLEPGEGPIKLEGLEGVQVYVLGPPRDPLLLKGSEVTEAHKKDDVIYHLSQFGDLGIEALGACVTAAPGSTSDRFYPFSAEHRITRQAMTSSGRRNPDLEYPDFPEMAFITETYDKEKWRQIDDDWLGAFDQLALDLDNDTNNTSLVLAFEFVDTREVLLFVGDAQVGNWQSWASVKFKVPGRAQPMPAHDLLARTVFYKVGHHCSHNATLKKGGLELMEREDLVAFIPLDKATAKAQGKKGWDMPAGPLFKALNKRAQNRVVISDVAEALTSEAKQAGVIATDTYIDYFLE